MGCRNAIVPRGPFVPVEPLGLPHVPVLHRKLASVPGDRWQHGCGTVSCPANPSRAHPADGVQKDVTFAEAEHALDDQIDTVSRAKYQPCAATFVPPMLTSQAPATTLKVLPHA
jgi:Uncharacterized protein conserved in bacteria (DUF2255)